MIYLYIKTLNLFTVFNLLKNHTYIKAYLMDLIVVDYFKKKKRFKVIYTLLSYKYNFRINIIIYVNEVNLVESVSNIFPVANWLEREAWDMFGICFFNHPDLRRIFTDYGFYGFALRKDFPLTGYIELQYDFNQRRIVQNTVSLSQEIRLFHYTTPWMLSSNKLSFKPVTVFKSL